MRSINRRGSIGANIDRFSSQTGLAKVGQNVKSVNIIGDFSKIIVQSNVFCTVVYKIQP